MTTPLNLSGLDLPRRNGELAFDAPWQSTVFALAAAVVENALGGDREPFRHQLIAAIAADPGRPYWESWTAALEALVQTLPPPPRPDRASPAPVTVGDHHSDRAEARIAAVLVGFSTFGVSPLQRTELADRAHACRCARRADGPRLFGPAGVIHPPAGRGDLL